MMRNLIKTKRQGIENNADRLYFEYFEEISKPVHTANVIYMQDSVIKKFNCVVVMTQLLNRALWPRGSEGLSPY